MAAHNQQNLLQRFLDNWGGDAIDFGASNTLKVDTIAESTSGSGTTFSNDVTVSGNTTFSGTVTNSDNVTMDGTLTVNGGSLSLGNGNDINMGTLADINMGTTGKIVLNVGATVAAGSSQSDATSLTKQVSYVTGEDGTKGVKLPTCAAGLVYIVYSTTATVGLPVYPNSSDDINDGTTNAAVTIEGKTMAIFVGMDDTTWGAIYTANT